MTPLDVFRARIGAVVAKARELIEDAADLADTREAIAAVAAGDDVVVPWETVRAELDTLPQ